VFLLVLFSLLQVLPVFASAHTVASARYAAITVALIFIGMHLGQLFGRQDPRFRAFTRGYCMAATLSALVAIGSLHPAIGQLAPDLLLMEGRPKGFFKDPNVLGPYLTPAVLALLYEAGQVRRVRRLACLGLALVCAAGVMATASRAAWINLALALAVYTLLSRIRIKTILMGTAAALTAALIAGNGALPSGTPEVTEIFSGRTQLQDYDALRFKRAREAFELGWRNPLGVGPGEITSPMDPHNTYARVWAENGPAALLLFVLILGWAAARTLREWLAAAGSARDATAAALALLAGLLVNVAVVDALHWRHFWVLLGLCVFASHAWKGR
jgi:O-antigen ligase